jgi:hypothetical protein
MRIGSNADRSAVWLEIPIVYHRDLPPNADIKSVSMSRKTVAGKVRWSLTIICTMPKPEQVSTERHTARPLALDLSYRLMPTGVRVGYWHDSQERGEITSANSGKCNHSGLCAISSETRRYRCSLRGSMGRN